jgi:hypothetical protein
MSSPKYKGHSTSNSNFVPLDPEQRTHVDTASAAYHLGRKVQTMRVWASTERGPFGLSGSTAAWLGRWLRSAGYSGLAEIWRVAI